MEADILAIGAHPDDVELCVGGTIHKMVSRGHRVVVADLTRGELGTRGTPETRAEEAAAAAAVLGVAERVNLGLPDGRLENTLDARRAVIEVVRAFRPSIVMCHHWEDLHPDHIAAGQLIRSAVYPAGLVRYPAGGEPHRPRAILFYMAHVPFNPSFVVDITGHFEAKSAAIACYASQLSRGGGTDRPTSLSNPDIMRYIEARDRHHGGLIQRPFGEAFYTFRHIPMDDPVVHYAPFSLTL